MLTGDFENMAERVGFEPTNEHTLKALGGTGGTVSP
jgi:hypothetical protein